MKGKIKNMFLVFTKRNVTNATGTVSQGEMDSLTRIPVYSIRQMTDERWNELAAESKRKLR